MCVFISKNNICKLVPTQEVYFKNYGTPNNERANYIPDTTNFNTNKMSAYKHTQPRQAKYSFGISSKSLVSRMQKRSQVPT